MEVLTMSQKEAIIYTYFSQDINKIVNRIKSG